MNAAKTLVLQRHSPGWYAHRAAHLNASEAPAMLSLSPYQSREELLKVKATGIVPEVDAATQARFDRGHAYEAAAREWVEAVIGDELFPVTMSVTVDDLPLSASLDGLTLDGSTAWEHKTYNEPLGEALNACQVPDHIWPQLEHILLVSGADKILLTASNGEKEGAVWTWYSSHAERRARLIIGWQAFAAALANWVPPAVVPEPIMQPIQQLPALLVQIEGRVLQTNLDKFRAAAEALISGIKTDLQDDADFAEAERAAHFCADAEKRLDVVKAQALAQTSSIEEVFRIMDGLKESLRATRLQLEKQVKARKESIRVELVGQFMDGLAAFVTEENARLGGQWLTVPPAALLAVAMKGRKSRSACQDALHSKTLEIKADLRAAAARFTRNRSVLRTDEGDHFSLFPDFHVVGDRSPEEFDALAELRIRRHREAEEQAAKQKAEQAAAAEAQAEAGPIPPVAATTATATETATPATPEPAPAGPASSEPPDLAVITAFMKSRDFGTEHSRIRSILVEFVKFTASRASATTYPQRAAA